MQAEFITYSDATIQAVWLKSSISRMNIIDSISNLTKVYCYNAWVVFRVLKSNSLKNIKINYLVVKEKIKDG